MSFNQTLYPGAANLLGNVDVPRNVNPLIRSRKRRLDPDGSSAVPYYSGANGKTLRIGYTAEVSTVVTPGSADITLSGDGIATIINDINTFATTNSLPIQALDLDGFLAIRNVNPGKTHYLSIDPFTTTPADDAASVIGFATSPSPGSVSYAGEIAATPGSRFQLNPQSTALIAKDASLGAPEINRPLAAILQMVENMRAELNRDVVVYRDVSLTFSAHATDGTISARINDDTLRVFYPKFPAGSLPIAPKDLNAFHRVLDSSGNIAIQDTHAGTENPVSIQVSNFFYATSGTPFTPSTVFSTWGTPDGGTIVADTVLNKNKHAATNITSIVGNVIECASATFVTKKVKVGDPVELVASTLQPFDHTGWFAVDGVISETKLAVRPMAVSEEVPSGSTKKPRWLNPAAGGTLRVAVGRFIPAGDLYVALNQSSLSAGGSTHVVRLAVGVPFISTLVDDRARDLSGTFDAISTILNSHIHAVSDAHPATAITGFTSTATWRDGTTIAGADLRSTIEDIITDLKAQASGNSGAGRVGAEAISIGGASPNSLAQGTVLSQLTALLTALQSHVAATSGAHAATAISYAGGGTWADSTTNPATTVEAQLDKIISDLSPSTGSAKIGGAASGSDIAAGTLAVQIADLAVNWLKLNRANTITALQTFAAGILLGNNKNVKLVGTGRYGFDNITMTLSAAHFRPQTGTFVMSISLSHWETTGGGSGGTLSGSLNLPEGTRIRSFTTWGRKEGHSESLNVFLSRLSLNTSDFSDTTSNVGSTSDTTTGFNQSTSSSGTLDHVIDSTYTYYFSVSIPVDGVRFHGIQVIYDYPVTVP